MAFRNLTPLPCLPFQVRTPGGELQQVVLVKVTLELVPAGEAQFQAGGFTHSLVLAREQEPVRCMDGCGPGEDCLPVESELAPGKPRCDVIVLGRAYAPGDRPARRFGVALTLVCAERPERSDGPDGSHRALRNTGPVAPGMAVLPGQARPSRGGTDGEVLVHKRLLVTGERRIKRRNPVSRFVGWAVKLATLGLVRRCPWKLTRPGTLTSLPLGYGYAFGGQVQVAPGDPGFRRLPRKLRRPGSGMVQDQWEPNPAGQGFGPLWHLRATRRFWLAAPQFEDPEHPFTARAAWRAMRGDPGARGLPELALQGMGAVPRTAWCRSRLAGTWDEAWSRSGSPYPSDFSPAYWNGAHPDLQCRLLEGDEILELTNLCPAGTPGAGRNARGDTVLRFPLPGLFPYVLVTRKDGERIQAPARLDTVLLQPAEGRVTCLHRACFPVRPGTRDLELRLIMPQAPKSLPIPAPGTVPEAAPEVPHGR